MSPRQHKKRRISSLKRQHIRNGEALHPQPPPPRPEPCQDLPDQEAPYATPISAHAILRYLERIGGVDVDQVRDFMLRDGRDVLIKAMKNGRIHIDQHCTLIVRDGTVVTILPP